MANLKFKSLNIAEWRQFESVNVSFHDRLTVLTGANASGKTTLLNNILGRHAGFNMPLGSTPRIDKQTGVWSFFTRWKSFVTGSENEQNEKESTIGNLYYSNDTMTLLKVPNEIQGNNPQYHLILPEKQNLGCVFVPSHRSIFFHRNIDSMPMQKKSLKDSYQEFFGSSKQRMQGNQPEPASMIMKRTLLGWAIQGFGNEKIRGDTEQKDFFNGFEEVLRKVLPSSLNFQGIEIRNNEIVFVCNDDADDFIFEQVSGGLAAIIDIVWQIFLFSTKENGNFTALIDEVENHLHPTMQRRILPDLLDAFPHVTFIVSTHSPLVVSSVKDSSVFAFRYNENGKIYSQQIDLVNEAKSANEVLDEVLGVSFSMPIWAEEALQSIVSKYRNIDSEDKLKQMRVELANNGLEKIMPGAINQVYDDSTN